MDLHTLYRHDALPIWLGVGFAAETGDGEANARAKLAKKKLDLIAANRVSVEGSGFESDDNALVVYWNDGQRALGPAPKTELADQLLDLLAERLYARTGARLDGAEGGRAPVRSYRLLPRHGLRSRCRVQSPCLHSPFPATEDPLPPHRKRLADIAPC